MHIVHFCGFFEPHVGGVENYVRSIADEHKKQGHTVTVVTANTENTVTQEIRDGIQVYRLPCKKLLGGTFPLVLPGKKTRELLAHLTTTKPDVVVTHTRFFSTSWLGARYAKKQGIPHVHTEHGAVHVPHNNPLVHLGGVLIDHTLGRYTITRAKTCVAISTQGEQFLKRLGAKQILYIPNGIRLQTIHKRSSKMREELHIHETTYVIAYVGRLIHTKGIQDLLEALKGMQYVTLLLAGEGPYRHQLELLAKQNTVDARFLGQQTTQQVQELLSTADLFVNPSHAEGLPTTVLEAAKIGVPILATDVGGTRDILPEECLVPSKNAFALREKIHWYKTHLGDVNILTNNTHAHVVKTFDIVLIAKNLEIVYGAAMHGGV